METSDEKNNVNLKNLPCQMKKKVKYIFFLHMFYVQYLCLDPRVEERPNGITAHSMPPVRRRGDFNLNTNTHDLLNREVVAVHRLLGLSRLSNRKGVKVVLPFETDTIPLKKSPAFLSTTEHRSPRERPSAHSQRLERSASSICTRFPFIGSMMSHSRATSEQSGLNGGKASDSSFHPE